MCVCVCVYFLIKRQVVVYKPVLWKNLQHLCWSSWTFLYPPSIIIVRINRFFPSRTVQSTKCQCGPIWFFSTKWKSLKKNIQNTNKYLIKIKITTRTHRRQSYCTSWRRRRLLRLAYYKKKKNVYTENECTKICTTYKHT